MTVRELHKELDRLIVTGQYDCEVCIRDYSYGIPPTSWPVEELILDENKNRVYIGEKY